MSAPLTDMRKQYQQAGLRKADCAPDPFRQLADWIKAAQESSPGDWFEVNAMTLSTAATSGEVSARLVLLKGLSPEGLDFYTNYSSQKGRELAANPQAALTFYWPHLERQVRVAGSVTKVSREQSDDYFHQRPRGSQLGAVVSSQSKVVANRGVLEQELARLETELEGMEVPLPDDWGGFRLAPRELEFWQGRPDRLHDRLRYRRASDGWVLERLAP